MKVWIFYVVCDMKMDTLLWTFPVCKYLSSYNKHHFLCSAILTSEYQMKNSIICKEKLIKEFVIQKNYIITIMNNNYETINQSRANIDQVSRLKHF